MLDDSWHQMKIVGYKGIVVGAQYESGYIHEGLNVSGIRGSLFLLRHHPSPPLRDHCQARETLTHLTPILSPRRKTTAFIQVSD